MVSGSYAEVMLVSSKSEPERWTVIRGNIDPGEIAAEASMRETRERSGTVGRLREPERPLGVWTNQDKRSKTSIFILDVRRIDWVIPAQITMLKFRSLMCRSHKNSRSGKKRIV